MNDVNPKHPRAESLKIREKLAEGFQKGLVTPEGLAAHGRGEAFDYILGERTSEHAKKAIKAGAAEILLAENPVLSVNGNVAALIPEKIAQLDEETDIKIEVNLFHRSKKREKKIAEHLKEHGVDSVLGTEKEYATEISEIQSHRRVVDTKGIDLADTVIVPLEDGDRTEALNKIGKTVITFDLNPMSRTAKAADITIVDNLVRAMPIFIEKIKEMKRDYSKEKIIKTAESFENEENLGKMLKLMLRRLEKLSRR